MKKILYLISSLVFFLCFSYSVKAYNSQITLNYDNYESVLSSNSIYSDIISGIKSRLDNTDFRYYITMETGTSGTSCTYDSLVSLNNYNTYCSLSHVSQTGSYYISLYIFNPTTYSENGVNDLYFGISGGASGFEARIGPISAESFYNDSRIIHDAASPTVISSRVFGFSSLSFDSLDTWLNNENRTYSNRYYHGLTIGDGYSTNYGNAVYNYVPYFIYSNFTMINKYVRWKNGNNYTNFSSNPLQIIKDSVTSPGVVNESSDFYFIMDSNQVSPPVVSNLGNDSYQISSNQIIITHSTALDTINCPVNSDFIDNFCYTNYNNYSNITDISSSNIFIRFDFGSNTNIPYLTDNYYAFTFRVDSNIDLDITNIIIYSGNLYNGRTPVNINKYAYGLYTDYQVIFQAPSDTNLSVTGVAVRLNSINSSDLSDFSLGVYNKYTYKQFGTTQPSLSEQNSYYNNNSIDTIDNNKSSWFTGFNINTRGLTSIVTAPFRYFRYIINSNGACSSLSLPTYYFGNIQLPCIQSILYSKIPDIVTLYGVIMSGLICYYVIVGYFRLVMVCFNPTDSRIEVVDL